MDAFEVWPDAIVGGVEWWLQDTNDVISSRYLQDQHGLFHVPKVGNHTPWGTASPSASPRLILTSITGGPDGWSLFLRYDGILNEINRYIHIFWWGGLDTCTNFDLRSHHAARCKRLRFRWGKMSCEVSMHGSCDCPLLICFWKPSIRLVEFITADNSNDARPHHAIPTPNCHIFISAHGFALN